MILQNLTWYRRHIHNKCVGDEKQREHKNQALPSINEILIMYNILYTYTLNKKHLVYILYKLTIRKCFTEIVTHNKN